MNAHENDKPGREEIENALIDFGISLLRHRLLSPSTSFQLQSLPAAVDNAYQALKIDCGKLSPENRLQLIFQALTEPQAAKPTLLPITELSLSALETPLTIDNLVAALQNAFDSLPAGGGRFGTFGYLMSYFGSRVALGAPDHPTLSVATYWKILAAAAFAMSQTPASTNVLVVSGDIAGLVEFLQVKASDQAAKNMRARSFYLQMLSQVLARAILREFDMPSVNLLFEGASRFLLMLPENTLIDSFLAELSKRLLLLHRTAPALQCAHLSLPLGALLQSSTFPNFNQQLAAKTSRANKRKLQYLLANATAQNQDVNFIERSLFQPHNGHEAMECNWCGVELTEDEIKRNRTSDEEEFVPRCSQCRHFGWIHYNKPGLAQKIADAQYVTISSSLAPNSTLRDFSPNPAHHFAESNWHLDSKTNSPTWSECIRYFGFNYALYHDPPVLDNGELLVLNPGWRGQAFNLSKLGPMAPDVQIGFRFLGIASPFTQAEDVRDTNEFCIDAQRPAPNGIGKIGSPLYGVLRMDGDGMGDLFGKCQTLHEVLALNDQTSVFFEGWVNRYCEEIAQIQLQHVTPTEAQCAYCLFAGGDDLLIVGPWLLMPELALAINDGYSRFVTTGNPKLQGALPVSPDLHLSGGIAMEKALFPLYQLDAFAWDNMKTSKHRGSGTRFLLRQRDGEALTFLGKSMQWQEFRKARDFAEQLCTLIEVHGIPRRFLTRLRMIAMQYEENLEAAWKNSSDNSAARSMLEQSHGWLQARWLWRASYGMQQAINECNPSLKPILSEIREQLLEPQNHPALITYLRVAVQWADLLSRTGEKI